MRIGFRYLRHMERLSRHGEAKALVCAIMSAPRRGGPMRQYVVDAFADRVFAGNQAAICVVGE